MYSIIIPTYNRLQPLSRCLESLSTMRTEVAFEVVVVDDGSPEPLEPHLQGWNGPLNLSLLRIDNGGPARARNLGAARAQGEYIVFLDDDCTVKAGWLESISRAIASTPEAAIGGKTVNSLPKNPYAVASQLLVDYLYDYFATTSKGSFFTTNNLCLRREAFLGLNGFDESFPLAAGEDREFCFRWTRAGKSLVHEPSVIVHHGHNLDLRRFFRQHFNYGAAARHYWKLRSGNKAGAAQREPLAFYLRLLAYPFKAQRVSLAAVRTSLLFLLAQIANAAGYFSAAL